MNFHIIFLALVASTISTVTPVDAQAAQAVATVGLAYLTCLAKYGFPGFLPGDVLNGVVTTTETQACFVKCMMENMNLISPAGDLIPFEVYQFVAPMIGDDLPKTKAIVNECLNETVSGDTVCGRSTKLFNCIVNGFVIKGIDNVQLAAASRNNTNDIEALVK